MRGYRWISVLILVACSALAEEPVDWSVVSEIKEEGFNNSHVMATMFYLTDVHGPRLTNSPNYQAASEWCVKQLTDWGLVNAKREAWGGFGRGWAVERFSIEMLEPQYLNLIAYPKAWTPGTPGTISGQPILLDLKSADDFSRYEGKLQGAIVMLKPTRTVAKHFTADAKRHTDEDLAELARAPEPGARSARAARIQEFRKRRAFNRKIQQFFRQEGVAVVLEASRREQGTITVSRGGDFKIGSKEVPPSLTVAIEHYSRITRMLEKDIPVKLEISVKTRFFEEDSLGYNVVAEIAGTDRKLKDELVMLGGHLDSWHSGTGATDNAAGCAVAMEAVRI
ncbi:MAG: M28 family peptidase, partial [bacterium]